MMIKSVSFPAPPLDINEVLRYAAVKGEADESVSVLLQTCCDELLEKLTYRACYTVLPLTIEDKTCHFGAFSVSSADLSRRLQGCQRAILFCVTVGIELDRLLARYSRLNASKALLVQAIGTERVEALCEVLCQHLQIEQGRRITARFSPGYGDFPIEKQKQIFDTLQCEKQIGVYLNESMIMTPTKSVTALVGVTDIEV